MKKKLLVIGAHSGDFVWRAAGTIARSLEEGAETLVVALSYGERGESGVVRTARLLSRGDVLVSMLWE